MKTTVKTRLLRGLALLLITITVPPAAAAVSWTASVVSSPEPAIVCYGHAIRFWLEDEQFEVTGLPEGEYWMRGSTTEYRWSVNNGQITGNGSSATISSGAAATVGAGNHNITFEGRTEYYVCWLDENDEEHCDGPISVGWINFGSRGFTIVKVASVSCSGVTSTTGMPGDAETVHVAIAEQDSTIAVSATPSPNAWPVGAPGWSMANPDESPSSGQTSVNARTDSAGAFTISAHCGSSAAAIILKVVGVYSLEPTIGEEIDDGDDDPDTRTFVVAAADAGVVTVNATPNPDVAEDKLPSGWSLAGGAGTGKLSRTIDRTTPGIYTLTCTCGTSQKTTKVIVVKVVIDVELFDEEPDPDPRPNKRDASALDMETLSITLNGNVIFPSIMTITDIFSGEIVTGKKIVFTAPPNFLNLSGINKVNANVKDNAGNSMDEILNTFSLP
jgi:hypothetical protein